MKHTTSPYNSLFVSHTARTMAWPVAQGIFQSLMQGQPYFIILMVVETLLAPLQHPGSPLDYGRLWLLWGWLALSLLLLFVASRAAYLGGSNASYRISAEGRLNLGDHLRQLSMGFFKGRDPGDITALMLQDFTQVETIFSHFVVECIGAVFLPLVFLGFLFPLNAKLTLMALSVIPAALLIALGSHLLIRTMGKIHIKAKNQAGSRMLEYLEGIKNLKSANLQGERFVRLEQSFRKLMKESIRVEAGSGPTVILSSVCLLSGSVLIMLQGLDLLLAGELALGTYLFFLIVGSRIYDPLMKILMMSAELSYMTLSVRRIREIRDTPSLPEPAVSVCPADNSISFHNVSFRYWQKDVIKDVSFHLQPGTMTALVGPSGSGKSTITRLIARFWDVDQGEIRVGGHPLRAWKTDELLSRISMVFQDVYLFRDTILANIRMGKPDATREEVMEASRKARCHDFISALPQGYDTLIGEGGSTLSGGEKQRISIARAILKDAPIVLLDEATACLDPENEIHIQQAIQELVRGRTLIVIAHRLNTVARAQRILVLQDGYLVEQGTHQDLLARKDGLYALLWREQQAAHHWKIGAPHPHPAPAPAAHKS